MWQLTRIELYKIFKKPRTYIAFAAIASIVFLIQMAMYADGETYLQFTMQSLQETFQISGTILNGYFICFIVLQTLLIHVPLLIALVSGDAIAGEANMGTLRLLLTKPVSRTALLLSKFFASSIYTLLLLSFMAMLSLFVSMLIFGTGDLIVLKSEMVVILDRSDILWRYFAAFGFAVQRFRHDRERAAHAGETAVFGKRAELNGTFARAFDFINAAWNLRVGDVIAIGGIEEQNRVVG